MSLAKYITIRELALPAGEPRTVAVGIGEEIIPLGAPPPWAGMARVLRVEDEHNGVLIRYEIGFSAEGTPRKTK